MRTKAPAKYHAAVYVRRKFKDIVMPEEDDPTTTQQVSRIKEQREEFPDVVIDCIYTDRKRLKQGDPRPEFFHLLKDIHAGKYNCIILYSLQTFGKDEAEIRYYLLKQFPMLRLRIISVHENYDSNVSEPIQGQYTGLISLVDRFSRSQSSRMRVVRSRDNPQTLLTHSSNTPYGYLYNPDIPECMEPDPVCAPAIPMIFQEYIAGTPKLIIARKLEAAGYPAPALRKKQLGYWSDAHRTNDFWTDSSVRTIVERRVYTGDFVLSTRVQKKYMEETTLSDYRTEETIIENHHQALITREVYEKAQLIRQASSLSKNNHASSQQYNVIPNLFRGLVFCGSCGRPMYFHTYNATGRYTYSVFRCASIENNAPDPCRMPNFRIDEMIEIVRNEIDANRTMAASIAAQLSTTATQIKVSDTHMKFSDMIQSETSSSRDTDAVFEDSIQSRGLRKYEAMISSVMEELSAITRKQLASGIPLTDEEQTQQSDLKRKLAELLEEKRSFYRIVTPDNSWVQTFLEIEDGYMITKPMARKLIKCITIYPEGNPKIEFQTDEKKDQLLKLIDFAKE